jgi:valyl-tRNA synthetase
MPFISEEIWQHLPHREKTLALAPWPAADSKWESPDAVKEMNLLMDIIRAVRNIRAEMNVPMSKKADLLIRAGSAESLAILEANQEYVQRFCNTSTLQIGLDIAHPEKAMSAVVTGAELYLPLAGLIDIDKELARLRKELQVLDSEVARVEKKLANEGFISKAPRHVVEEERAKHKDYAEKREKVLARIKELTD